MSTICDDLRIAILQAAMQGKLTEQSAEDESAEELLGRIKAEKEKLSKKKKTLPISEDEAQFEIPSSWRWQKLENISVFIGDKSNQIKESSVKKDGKHKVVSQSKELFIGYCDDDEKLLTISNPVLVFGDHTALVKYIDFDFIIGADGVKVIEPLCMDVKYLYYALKYNLIGVNELGGYSRHYKFIKDKLIPIPPLAEQKRIVERIDELMARVADLEKSADALASLKKAFPSDIKAALLRAAMQGKLTKQLPGDGDAVDLLEQIKTEKEKLVAEGKIKKQKALAPIVEGEFPFDIPENWQWVRFGEVIELVSGVDLTPDKYNSKNDGVVYITGASCIEDGMIIQNRWTPFPAKIARRGDLLLTCKGTVGTTAIMNIDEAHIARQIMAIRPFCLNISFVKVFVESIVPALKSNSKGLIPGIERKNVLEAPLPLPPLAEQERIVERLDALMQNIEVVGDLIAAGE